jgi:arginyl-tRNA synthetase
LEAFTELIAVAALKYQILRQKVGSNIVFDKAQALSFEGDSGPYLQYTYARTNSVLEKGASVGVSPNPSHVPVEAYEVERILYRFSEALEEALLAHSPHHAVTFLVELASTFNTFYAQEKIADTSDEFAPYKLLLTHAVKQTLQNGLFVLGMKAPEKM